MNSSPQTGLSRRERQIMDIVYRLNEATIQQVLDEIPSAPGYSAVRATMRILEEKGFLSVLADDGGDTTQVPVKDF